MNSRNILAVIILLSAMAMLGGGTAEAANGTVKVTFKHKDAAGVEQPLSSAYLYLRDGAEPPPLEKSFRNADYIFGPSDGAGRINASVPEGTYYVRLTRREPLDKVAQPLGPPEAGDYTWTDYNVITVTADGVTDLGTKYADFFSKPITITGVVVNSSNGVPLVGRYVRAQPEPCIEADYSSFNAADWVDSNRCGPEKYMAQRRTDDQGRYTLLLREPGTYYIIESKTLGDKHVEMSGNRSSTGWAMGPITVNAGDTIVLDDMQVPPAY
ncbi:MAG: hypothetical protein M8357_07460 [Desulfobulbaceae bacterium]|nr:hypothetical protein [Desulfobulbaceae bacterium]